MGERIDGGGRAMVVAAAQEMVGQVTRLQQETLLTIAELRMLVMMGKHTSEGCCFKCLLNRTFVDAQAGHRPGSAACVGNPG